MDATSSEGNSRWGGIAYHPHAELQIAKKLNPNLQVWLWAPARISNINASQWVPIEDPVWMPFAIYTVTSGRRVNPDWTPLIPRTYW